MDIYESDLTMTYKYAGKMVKNRLKHIMIAHASLNLSPYEGKTAPTLKLVGLSNQCSKQGSRQVGKRPQDVEIRTEPDEEYPVISSVGAFIHWYRPDPCMQNDKPPNE